MNPGRWRKVEEVYQATLEQPEEKHAAFLSQACGEDEDLRREIEEMLKAQKDAGSFLGQPAVVQLGLASEPEQGKDSLVGRRLGVYEIEELIGKGGMGEVYRAQDTRLERRVALKILQPQLMTDAEHLKRFRREAKAASALNHPNIATIHDVGEAEGFHYLVMEFVTGQTLAEKLKKGPLEVQEVLKIGIQATEALEAAHGKGIIHRDIKPANLMLTPEGWVKVLDFGLAKQARQEGVRQSTVSQTTPGLVMGTVEYMSPEQVLGHEVDHRTDLFSLGVTLYDMVAGRLPFQGSTPTETMDQILHREPESLVQFNEKLPVGLEPIVRKCLEKDRDLRYQTASDLCADLKRLKRDTDSGKSGAYPAAAARILPGWNAKRWIAIATLLAALTILFCWYLYRQKSEGNRAPMRIVPFTTLPGMAFYPKFSPDGKFVSFTWNGDGDNFDIYVKQVGQEGQLRLTSDPAFEWYSVWSPDGGEIAFYRGSGEFGSIYTIPSLGGAERKLYEFKGPADSVFSWSPDGRWLAFSESSSAESPSRIYLLSLDTRQKIPLTSPPPGPYGDLHPEFSRDGKRVVFVRQKDSTVCDIWVQPLSSGEATRLTNENCEGIGPLALTADGREVVFSIDKAKTQTGNLYRIPLTGGVPQLIAGIGDNAALPTIWGNRMVFMRRDKALTKIWRMRGPNYQGKNRSTAPILASTQSEWYPDYSPDGKKIAFNSDRSGFSEIWTSGSNGENPVQLTHLRKNSYFPRWSPEGKKMAFEGSPEEDSEIYTVDADAGIPLRMTHEKSQDQAPSWSRDGRWIYFSSNRSGTFQLWKMPSEGGQAIQVTKGGGFYAMESFDGKMLYYIKPGRLDYASGQVWKVPCDGGEETLVLDRVVSFGNVVLRQDGLYFANSGEYGKSTIEYFSFKTGKATLIYHDETHHGDHRDLAISPDDQWFLYSLFEFSWGSNLMLVENFK